MLQNKTQSFGCWLGLADTYTAEISAVAGFDWLLIDNEHAPNDLRSTHSQLAIIHASNAQALVRLPTDETWMIKQYLDAGAQNILIPMVETAEQAKKLVDAIHYPPKGKRGVGAALARVSQFSTIEDYLQTADAQICLMIQIETTLGMNNLDEILNVDDIDGVFIGPADFAADMGYLGNMAEPKVQANIDKMIVKIANSSKACGILMTDEKLAKHYAKLGASFIAVGIDVTIFANAMKAEIAKYK